MKLTIFGATGQVGRHLVEQALERGHSVTAFSRNPGKLGITHDNLRLAAGDVLHPEDVEAAIRDQDTVICALGDGRRGAIRASGTEKIIEGMKKTGVKKLICQSTLGVGESWGNLNFVWKYLMFGAFLRAAFADHVKQEELVRGSGLDWIIVRPSAFADGLLTGEYRHGFPSTERGLTLKISKADVADFILNQVSSDEYLHETPGVSN